MDMTRPSSGHDQAVDPLNVHHPEEEEHHESGASKMFKRVKARAKKIKNSLTKHGNEQDHDVDEEDDENDEQVHESSAARDDVRRQPEPLSHPGETKVPAPEEITPPGTRVVPVLSSDYTERVEPKTLRDASYGHDLPPTHPVKMSDREESREALLSETEDVPTRTTFAPPGEDEFLDGQSKVNIETPRRLEEDQYQSDFTKGGGEAGVAESLSKMKVGDESHDDEKSGIGSGRDLPARSHEFEWESESGIGKDSSPARFGGESGAELGKDFPGRSFEADEKTESGFGGKPETGLKEDFPAKGYEFDQKMESRDEKGSRMGFGEKSGTGLRENFPEKSYEFDQLIESGDSKDSLPVFGGEPGTGLKKDFPAKSHGFDHKFDSEVGKDSPTWFGGGKPGTGLREDFPAKPQEFDQKIELGTGMDPEKPGTEEREDFLGKNYEFDQEMESQFAKDSTKGSHDGYGEETKSEVPDKNIPARDSPMGTKDQFSPELSHPKESDDFETRDETQEPKPTTYTEMIKNAVTSKLGYSGEDTGAGGQYESPAAVETPGSVAEKFTPVDENVKETGSPVTTKLPLSGGGSGAEETEQREEKVLSGRDYLAAKLKPGEEDKALSEMITEKLSLGGEKKTTTKEEVEKIPSDKIPEEKEHDKAVSEESYGGGGMVEKIKGAYNYWIGGTTEEVKPKSPVSGEESSQSLGSTVGTKGFPDSGESGLGETGGVGGAGPVHRGL